MPKALPKEFRRDVVAVVRRGESTMIQIAKDFGVSPAALYRWLKIADIQDGLVPGVTKEEAAQLREARKRIRFLEQEAEVMRRVVTDLSRDVCPK